MKIYDALIHILQAVQSNHNKMREEPNSDGEVHDKWEEENDALDDLEESLEDTIEKYETASELRKSLKKINL